MKNIDLRQILEQYPDDAEVNGAWKGITTEIHDVIYEYEDNVILLDVDV